MLEGLDIRQGLFDTDLEFKQLVTLQNEVYKERGITFTVDGFKRWYVDNPLGKAISFNAFDGDKMVAHYVCIPTKMIIDGRVVDGIKSMATVTHPNYRGRGLFKTLAKMTYDYAKEHGYEFVVGVANANSFPGFMKYFPFTFVGKLEVKLGYGLNIIPAENKTFYGFWDKNSMIWRKGAHAYKKSGSCILGKYGRYVRVFMGHFDEDLLSEINFPQSGLSIKPLLYVGLGAKIKSPFFNVPKFIKHSPFNLIFLDLTDGKLPIMTKDNVFFQLFDFDVA